MTQHEFDLETARSDARHACKVIALALDGLDALDLTSPDPFLIVSVKRMLESVRRQMPETWDAAMREMEATSKKAKGGMT